VQIHTNEGLPLTVRRLQANDGPLLVRFFHMLSPQTRLQRYLRPLDTVSPRWVRQHARIIARRNPALQIGLLALLPLRARGELVAGAQLVRPATDSQEAELGIVVRDDFQRRGIGGQLLRLLLEQGRAAGLQRVSATMYAENEAMWRALRRLGLPLRSEMSSGERTVVVSL
jgi:acetyltransferase